jgi:hypothetical protein
MSYETGPFLWRPVPGGASLLVCLVCLGMGLRRKPLLDRRLMMSTPEGAVFSLEASFVFPSLRLLVWC